MSNVSSSGKEFKETPIFISTNTIGTFTWQALTASAVGDGPDGEDQMRRAGHRQQQLGQAFDHGPAAAIGLGLRGLLATLEGRLGK